MNTTVFFVDSSIISSDNSLNTSSVVPSDNSLNTSSIVPTDNSLNTSSVVPTDNSLNTSSVVPTDNSLNTFSVTYDSSMISWDDPYDTYDVEKKCRYYRCHYCKNPLNKKRILTFAERPYGQGSSVVHAYYFCKKDCQKNFVSVALKLTNKNVNQILKIKDEPGLWAIQSKFPALSHDRLGLYVYKIKDDTTYSKIYTLITISKINESEVVGNFNEQVYVDSRTRYIDDDESEEIQSCVPNDDVQSF